MKFQVYGTRHSDGKRVSSTVDAPTMREAIEQVTKLGMLVDAAHQLVDMEPSISNDRLKQGEVEAAIATGKSFLADADEQVEDPVVNHPQRHSQLIREAVNAKLVMASWAPSQRIRRDFTFFLRGRALKYTTIVLAVTFSALLITIRVTVGGHTSSRPPMSRQSVVGANLELSSQATPSTGNPIDKVTKYQMEQGAESRSTDNSTMSKTNIIVESTASQEDQVKRAAIRPVHKVSVEEVEHANEFTSSHSFLIKIASVSLPGQDLVLTLQLDGVGRRASEAHQDAAMIALKILQDNEALNTLLVRIVSANGDLLEDVCVPRTRAESFIEKLSSDPIQSRRAGNEWWPQMIERK